MAFSAGFTEMLAGLAISRLYPSGADLATLSAAMEEPAPARFSITIGWPEAAAEAFAEARATVSAAPPGAKPTTRRMGLLG